MADSNVGRTLTWLHLSDLHARKSTDWDSHYVLKTLKDDLESFLKGGIRPDLIFFTGDAAFGHLSNSPIDQQFDDAFSLLEEIRGLCGLERKHVFLVPGNHDVDRREVLKQSTSWLAALERSYNLTAIEELFENGGKELQVILDRLGPYRGALARHGYDHLLQDRERLHFGARFQIRGLDIGVAGLNSAWSCARNGEKGKLWLAGRWQLQDLASKLEGADLRIGLVHHPLSWICEKEGVELEPLFDTTLDFYLHGHEHQAWLRPSLDGASRIAAGACYDRSDRENGYNLVHFDFEKAVGQVHLRQYDRKGRGWVTLPVAKFAPGGIWPLRNLSCFERLAPRTVEPLSIQRSVDGGTSPTPLDDWFAHVSDAHGQLAACFNRPGRLNLITEAWVELQVQPDLSPHKLSSDKGAAWAGRRLTLDEALALTEDDASWITGRWLLEGPPGSGKTTMLRHFARRLADARDRSRIPLFVSLSRVVGRDQDWLAVATDGFQITGGAEIVDGLRAAAAEGRLVVLLDGLDEVPPERRPAVHKLLGDLRRDWSDCPVVLSTRPLGRGGPLDGFPRLELLPLTTERQTEFLVKWFTEAGRPQEEAEQEAASALARFAETRGLRELSGIPLYLTLLAILWQSGGRPPERLALLYDDIFALLLKGEHRGSAAKAIPAAKSVREMLRHVAAGMTEDDRWAESLDDLDDRLRVPEATELRRRLETVQRWKDDPSCLFHDVHEQTSILGPHDGRQEDWRFWHRTFREALTAEQLWNRHGADRLDLDAVAAWARDLPQNASETEEASTGEGRWAEPLALLAGRLPEPDALVSKLAEVKPGLALRSMVFTQGLQPETLVGTLGLTDDLEERAQVFEEIPDQLADPGACLALVDQLKEGRPGGFDLFWLGWILDQVGDRWPGHSRPVEKAQGNLFEHIPEPDPDLFRFVDTGLDGRVPLWSKIPAGQGWIGSPKGEEGRFDREGPRHRITVENPFFLSVAAITNRQYAAFDPSKEPQRWDGVSATELLDHPRVRVDWWEAMAFCRWLSTCAGFGAVRLPTEEEWEYACRAGSETPYWKGDSEEDLGAVGWYDDNSGGRAHTVGEKPANPWKLYDMHGNVWEWTVSPWNIERYKGRSVENPFTVDPAATPADLAASPRVDRVVRGGSCWHHAHHARSADRNGGDPRIRNGGLGFRVLLPSAPSEP